MSRLSESERIIAEQEARHQKRGEEQADRTARDREPAEWRRAWDGVAYWLTPDGDVADADTLRPAPPAKAVAAIAHLNKLLAARGLLDKLAEPPRGVEGEDLQPWHLAVDILYTAADDPQAAELLLARDSRLPCAPTVRTWLRHGFRIVVEGRWQTGPLCVEMLPTRVVNARPAASQPGDSQTTEADAGLAGLRANQAVPQGDAETVVAPATAVSDERAPDEDWMPAQKAVERARQEGVQVTLPTLSKWKNGRKPGLRTRARTLAGRHRWEVEYNSLLLVCHRSALATGAVEPIGSSFDERIGSARAARLRGRG